MVHSRQAKVRVSWAFAWYVLVNVDWNLRLNGILDYSALYSYFMYSSADTSRHYYPVDVIKQVIESMSYAKLVRHIKSYLLCSYYFVEDNYLEQAIIWSACSKFWFFSNQPTKNLKFSLHSLECPSLAHHRWRVLSSGSA